MVDFFCKSWQFALVFNLTLILIALLFFVNMFVDSILSLADINVQILVGLHHAWLLT